MVQEKCTEYLGPPCPILICGHTRSCYNYALHSDDKVAEQRAFGGGLSTVSFSLKVLYDQNQRGLNRWTYPNDQLDLARYTGCYFLLLQRQRHRLYSTV